MRSKVNGNRTMLFDGDEHVGTIIEMERKSPKKPGTYQFIHSGGSDFVETDYEARRAIEKHRNR